MPPSKRKAEDGATSTIQTKKIKLFPARIGWSLTIAQLREEAEARGLDLSKLEKQDKHSFLGVLGEGSASIVAADQKGTVQPVKKKPAVFVKSNSSKGTTKDSTKTAAKKEASSSPMKSAPSKKMPPTAYSKKSKAISKAGKSVEENEKSILAFAVHRTNASTNSIVSKKQKDTAKNTNNPTVKPKPLQAKVPSKSKPLPVAAAAAEPDYPRLSSKLTLAQLKEEVIARQLDMKKVPKLKAELLHYLIEGSIYVKETTAYKSYQMLLTKVETEKSKLYAKSLENQAEAQAKKDARQRERYAQEEHERLIEQQRRTENRKLEIVSQKHLHTHDFKNVHCHPLAISNSLKHHKSIRNGRCDLCNDCRDPFGCRMFSFDEPKPAIYSCDECDWDICQDCFQKENKSEAEKNAARRKAQAEAERQRRLEEEQERQREEEELARWDATNRFEARIMKPPAKNKSSKGAASLKFTVWCSDGYDNDRWHSYEGAPTKEFDSRWTTKKEANQRAEYLFFWKNPWGLAPNEINDEDGDPEASERDGMHSWEVAPPDSSRWSVGVVPSAAYPHLENSTQQRHNYDDESEPKSYEEHYSYGGCAF